MPKKRHTNLYTKPPSTLHHAPSSSSAGAASATSRSDVAPKSVNELLMSSRRNQASPMDRSNMPVITPTMPGQIRQILDIPETPTPQPRGLRRRIGLNGRLLPPGPAPPRSWLENSMHATPEPTDMTDNRPRLELDRLPGFSEWPKRTSLRDTVFKQMASDWEFHEEYDQYYLATLPTSMRMMLLSYIAVFGPREGICAESLSRILKPSEFTEDFKGNDDFTRLDLAGSVGRSFHLKSLSDMVYRVFDKVEETEADEDWSFSLSTAVPSNKISGLRYLSLAAPCQDSNLWAALLKAAPDLSTLTHLSLAYWPTPELSPNSQTATVTSRHGRPVRYGATGYYAHTLFDDWSEAAGILRRLSMSLYGLEWIDLDGCSHWFKALAYSCLTEPGINWSKKWDGVKVLQLRSGIEIDIEKYTPESSDVRPPPRLMADIIQHKQRVVLAMEVEQKIRRQRSRAVSNSARVSTWIEVLKDDFKLYDSHLDSKGSADSLNQLLNEQLAEPPADMGFTWHSPDSAWD